MSKVVVTYDTETKDLQMSIDGQDKGKLERFHVYANSSDDDKYGYFEAEFKSSKENGVRYSMSAHGSKFIENDILQSFARDALSKKLK